MSKRYQRIAVTLLGIVLFALMAVLISTPPDTVDAAKPPTPTPGGGSGSSDPVVKYSFNVSGFCGVLDRPDQQFGRLSDGRTLALFYEGNRKLCALAYDGSANPPVGLWTYNTSYGSRPAFEYHPKFSIADVDGDGQAEVVGMVSVAGGCDALQVRNGLSGAVEASTVPTRNGACAVPWQESEDNILHTRNYVALADGTRILLNTENDSVGETWEFSLSGGALTQVWSTEGDGKTMINHHYAWRVSFGGPEKILALTSHLDGSPARSWYEPNGAEGGPEQVAYAPIDDYRNHFDKCVFDGTNVYCSLEARRLIKFNATTKLCDLAGGANDKIGGYGDFMPSHAGRELLIYLGGSTTSLWDPATCSQIKLTARRIYDCITMDYDANAANGEECLAPDDGGILMAPDTSVRTYLKSLPGAPAIPTGQKNFAAPVDLIANGLAEEISVYNGQIWAIYAHPTVGGTGTRWSDACYGRNVASGEYDIHPERNYACP